MPHWVCNHCGTRLYSASESLKWRDCPVCAGKLEPEPEDAARFEHKPGKPAPGAPRVG